MRKRIHIPRISVFEAAVTASFFTALAAAAMAVWTLAANWPN